MNDAEIDRNQELNKERQEWKGRPKKGRRNKFPGQTFATRKNLKDKNLPHYTIKGKFKPSRQFLNEYSCNCIKQCNLRVSSAVREEHFTNFWQLASYDLQTGFIASTVQEMPIKRRRSKKIEEPEKRLVELIGLEK